MCIKQLPAAVKEPSTPTCVSRVDDVLHGVLVIKLGVGESLKFIILHGTLGLYVDGRLPLAGAVGVGQKMPFSGTVV